MLALDAPDDADPQGIKEKVAMAECWTTSE